MSAIPVTTPQIVAFHRILTGFYYESGRHDMLWRQPGSSGIYDPYRIMVSELMLQQTQVKRVTPKYEAFLHLFPTVRVLSEAALADVLTVWSGLGYNRRAKYIWQAAQSVVKDFSGEFPQTIEELQRLPGIGPNTAGAIMAYSFNQPVVFIETNIRTVIIHHFFNGQSQVADKAIREVMAATVPLSGRNARALQGAILGPREFYWAMMDYGVFLKKTIGNLNRASRHYTKQSAFAGSKRQLRGKVIRTLTAGPAEYAALQHTVGDARLDDVLDGLIREGLVSRSGESLRLS